MSTPYWRGAVEDEAMQDEHGFIWKAMLDTIDVDLTGKRVLDAGCNRGGFLRLLVDAAGIAQGYGYDPAAGAVADAQRLTGNRPLVFQIADTVPDGWSDFDTAFSHEVLYLLGDLASHAASLFDAVRPGGTYFAVMSVHEDSPTMSAWHADSAFDRGPPRSTGARRSISTSSALDSCRLLPNWSSVSSRSRRIDTGTIIEGTSLR